MSAARLSVGAPVTGGAARCWTPAIPSAFVADPRFPPLLRASADGVDFSAARALVTGASAPRTIGHAIAQGLLAGGATVVIAGSRPLPQITATAEALVAQAGGGRAIPVRFDQGDPHACAALIAWSRELGGFTHLYPFAAIHTPKPFFAIDADDYARAFAVNAIGVYQLCVRHARTRPRGEPWWVVVPLSPNDGRLRGSGLYSPTKQALRPIVIQGQHEVGERHGGAYIGIDLPWTRTGMMAGLEDVLARAQDLGLRIFTPDQTAAVCLLAGTPAARTLAGTTLDAGGGFGAVHPHDFARLFARDRTDG
ncbi:MAG: SDR family oxidoreductase [Planctomycetota bacterium]